MSPRPVDVQAAVHADDAHHAAWTAWLAGVPMTWISTREQEHHHG